MAIIQPDFLQARLHAFAHRYREHGLWHWSLAATEQRGELNGASFQRREIELNRHVAQSMVGPIGLYSLVVLYLVLNGLVVCVLLVEVGYWRIYHYYAR